MGERRAAGPPAGHVVLVGLPGAGKTTVGRLLAARLSRPFVDFDEEIVRRTGRTVAEIFTALGEQHFRDLEAELTREVAGRPPSVVAPGGGWIAQPGMAEMLGIGASIIHLDVSPATAVARMAEGVASRPLLAGGDARQRIETLAQRRRDAYARAHVVVNTEMLDTQEVTDAIIRAIAPAP